MPQAIALQWGRKTRRPPIVAEVIAAAQAGRPGALLAVPGATPPLRLNSDDGRRYPPDLLAQVPDNIAKLEALKEEAARDVDLFARNQRAFLDLYFDFIEARVTAEQAALKDALAWSGGLFTPHDFVFSAYKPLPNAVIAAAEGAGDTATACDFAFWTGEHLVAVGIAGAMAGAQHEDRSDGAVLRIAVPAADLASIRSVFTPERFPPEMFAFWRGEETPGSPFRPEGLGEIIPG